MQAEGDGVFARHAACAAMTRAGLRALGFELLAADDVASKTVTSAWIPESLDWKAFNAGLKARGLVLAGGQGKLKGRIFRVGHLGSVTTDEILAAIGTLEAVAVELGLGVEPGAAVAAAQRALVETARTPAGVA
jgi:aspartate aminotransferase-like enzyme